MERQKLPGIKQLQCFLAVAQELNFRRAAEKLHMTQPPLTRQIQNLEESIGCRVLMRSKYAVQLTPAGILLEKKAREIIDQLAVLVGDLRREENKLQIGLTSMLDFNQIAGLSAFITMPEAGKTFFQFAPSRQLLQQLMHGELDVVLAGEKALTDDSLVYNRVHTEPLLVALPESHPAAVLEKVGLEDIADLPLFWFPRNSNIGYYEKCEAVFKQSRSGVKKIQEPDDMLILLSAVARSKGYALMPQSLCVSSRSGLCYRPLTADYQARLNIDVYLVHRKNDRRELVMDIVTRFTQTG